MSMQDLAAPLAGVSKTDLAQVRGRHQVVGRLLAARENLRLYQERLLPGAKARLAAIEAGYKTSVADFRDLLDSERFLLEAKAMKIKAEKDVGVWTTHLEWAIGKDLYEQKKSNYQW